MKTDKSKILRKHLGEESITNQAIRYAVYDAMEDYAQEFAREKVKEAVKLARTPSGAMMPSDGPSRVTYYTEQEILEKLKL